VKERDLSVGVRLLLGILGATAVGTSLAVGAYEIQRADFTASFAIALAVALLCAVVAMGGVHLLRGAWRGRIAVRRPRGGRRIGERREPRR
jgi:hypothetical protein